jgi:DNA-directed RNA polymerase subunit H (RpoH/RPB5)
LEASDAIAGEVIEVSRRSRTDIRAKNFDQ